MTKAIWNGQVIAESDRCEIVEGNSYFPPNGVKQEFLRPSDTHTTCGWKGVASYHDVAVGGQVNKDAAWYYPDPKPAARRMTASRGSSGGSSFRFATAASWLGKRRRGPAARLICSVTKATRWNRRSS